MKIIKIALLVIGIIIVGIQFIRPARNTNDQILVTDITNVVHVPDNVILILQKTCYDCHSNNTRYPWYMNIQPVGWRMAKHIKDGKGDLNFSEFGSYPQRRQLNKLNEVVELVSEDLMPLKSYKKLHKDARLSDNEKQLFIAWAKGIIDTLPAEE